MITEKVSIILDDKNIHDALISRVINIIKDEYRNGFTVDDLNSVEELTVKDKKYLRKIFAPDITGLYVWEHSFYFLQNMWHYDESDKHDYRETVRQIMLLLNKGKIAIGERIKITHQLIKNIYYDWFSLLDSEMQHLYETNFSEREFIIFISHNLNRRIGKTCFYNFEFLKTFMEAKKDYDAKKLMDAIFGIKTLCL